MPVGYTTDTGQTVSAKKKKTNTQSVLPSPIQKTSFDPARSSSDPNRGAPGGVFSKQDFGPAESGTGDPYSGFASRYTTGPGAAEILQREPQVVLADVMRSMGMSPNGGMYGMAEPSADFANALYMLSNGGQLGTNEQMLNWMADYFANQMQPGGPALDVRGLMGNIFSGAGQNQMTPLGGFLTLDANGNVLDPRGQVSRLDSLVQAAAGYGVPLIMQQALGGQMGLLGRDYLSAAARGAMSGGNYNDYIAARQNNPLAPFVGMT